MCFISVSSVRINGMINDNGDDDQARGREKNVSFLWVARSNCLRVTSELGERKVILSVSSRWVHCSKLL